MSDESFPYRKVRMGVEQALEEAEEKSLLDFPWAEETPDAMRRVADCIMEVLSDPIYRDSLAEFVAELQAKAKE